MAWITTTGGTCQLHIDNSTNWRWGQTPTFELSLNSNTVTTAVTEDEEEEPTSADDPIAWLRERVAECCALAWAA